MVRTFDDKLVDAARIYEEAPGMANAPFTDEQRTEILDWLRATQQEHGLTNAKVARMIGVSPAVISQVKAAKYAGDTDKVLAAVVQLRLMPTPRRRDAVDDCVPTRFVLDVHARVKACADLAFRGQPRMGLIVAPSGCGKSMALQACARKYPAALYVELDESITSVPAFLRALADRLGCPVRRPRRDDAFRWIVDTLSGSCRLLIFDEVHHGGVRVLNVIRQVMDQTGCPVVLAGQPVLEEIVMRTARDRSHGGTVHSRIGPRLNAEDAVATRQRDDGHGKRVYTRQRDLLHSVDDVVKVIEAQEMRLHPSARRLVTLLANHPEGGMLRTVVFVALQARLANPDATMLTESLLLESLEHTLTIAEFETLRAQIETSEVRQRVESAIGAA